MIFVLDSSVLIDLVHGGIDRDALAAFSMETPALLALEVSEYSVRLEASGLTFVPLGAVEEALSETFERQFGSSADTSKRQQKKRLSKVDCDLLALAKSRGRCLLVADQALREAATANAIESKGLLWLIEEMANNGIMDSDVLAGALERISMRPRCRLPRLDVQKLLERLRISR